jgi:site-specific recombinase XerD
MNMFRNNAPNIQLAQVTTEFIERFLDKRTSSAACKDTDRRAVSRFFSWCIERPRRWAVANPCREVRIHQEEKGPVAILSVEECKSHYQGRVSSAETKGFYRLLPGKGTKPGRKLWG